MFLSKFGNIKTLIISDSHNNKLLQLWYQYEEPCHLIKWAESTVLAYKLTSNPWKVAVMIPMWASQMACFSPSLRSLKKYKHLMKMNGLVHATWLPKLLSSIRKPSHTSWWDRMDPWYRNDGRVFILSAARTVYFWFQTRWCSLSRPKKHDESYGTQVKQLNVKYRLGWFINFENI